MTTRAATLTRLAALGGASILLAGCGVLSPVQTNSPYIPADGVPLSLPGLELRNLAVVTDAEGSPGVLVGQAVNNGSSAVDVNISVEGEGEPTTVVVPANSGDPLSDDSETVRIESVPAAPGSLVELVVSTREAGDNAVRVPVLAPEGPYSELLGS